MVVDTIAKDNKRVFLPASFAVLLCCEAAGMHAAWGMHGPESHRESTVR
jgi:hypothetical protein